MDVAAAVTDRQLVTDEVGERCQKLFQDFLKDFRHEDSDIDEAKYLEDARNLIRPERNSLTVAFPDIQDYNQNLATVVTQDYYRVYPYLCRALKNFLKDEAEINIPSKEFYIAISDVPTRLKVRELSTAKVGTLIRISGQVVRTHPVHPELVSGTFTCMDCQTVVKNVEQQFKYTQPTICPNQMCANRSRFELDCSASRFVDFQKIRIQETQAELPRGSVPRSMEVIVRAEAVEGAQAGDQCDFIGTLIVVPDVGALNLPGARAEYGARNRAEGSEDSEGLQGLKALGVRELHYKIAFLACNVQQSNPKFAGKEWALEDITVESLKNQMSDQEWSKIFEMCNDKRLYSNLMSSLFPTIHGNDEVKKGLLLMLFGGVPKTTEEKTTLRGDINICIVGDPSTAKSQFLKQVADFCPRAVYTSGKASSAAGLTAAVVKDEESHEFVIEAGALMLADNGVCCIDEFDKMDPRDQVAIHESMEQQTISITKAGIKATLNARTSILAAANPIGGRYDRGKSLRKNINLGAPLISRFDLFFILVDDCNEVTDYAIARKIVDLHTRLEESVDRVYSQEEILRYITFARQFKPVLSKEACDKLVECYKTMRMRDNGTSNKNAWRITVRQLESLIRLAEALARMFCKDLVTQAHIEEAFRLLNKSIIRVEQPDIDFEDDGEHIEATEEDEDEIPPQPTGDDDSEPMDTREMCVQSPYSIHSASSPTPSSQGHRRRMKMSYEEYKQLSAMIISHMQREEVRLEEEGSDEVGLKRSQIVDWYLNEIGDSIDSEAELIEKKELVEKVIHRLINHDKIIISLVDTDLATREKSEPEDPVLVIHPDYVTDMV